MLSSIGLALDFVGAFALVVGLFGHARPLFPGYNRSPEDVAHDIGFGVVGAVLLASGFVLQSIPYFISPPHASHRFALVAWGCTLVGSTVIGWLAYGAIYLVALVLERRRGGMKYSTRRERRGVRFWHQVPADNAGAPEP
jgi:hypothetical protein